MVVLLVVVMGVVMVMVVGLVVVVIRTEVKEEENLNGCLLVTNQLPRTAKQDHLKFSSVSIVQCAFSICANLHFTFPCFACFAFAPAGTLVGCTHDDG